MNADTIIVILEDREFERVILRNERHLYEIHHYRPGDRLADRLRKIRNALWNLA